MLIGINSKCYTGSFEYEKVTSYTEELMFPILVKCGFQALQYGLRSTVFSADSTWQNRLKEIKKIADDCGLVIPMVHPPIYHVIEKYDESPLQADIQEKCFEAAAVLGAKWAVIHPQFPKAGIVETDAHYESVVLRNREYLNKVCLCAARYNISVAFENIKRYTEDEAGNIPRYGWKPEQIIDAVDHCGAKNVGICLDTGHSMAAGIDPAEAIKACGSRIQCVHLHDTDGASDQHRIPYMAPIDWDATLTALKQTGFSGVFMLEVGESIKRMPTLDLLVESLELVNHIARHMVSTYF